MSINTHISNWINRAEDKIDYYSLFIKAWIPYNAWYMHNFYDEDSTPKRDRDSAIIFYINSTSNRYRDKIISLLRGSDELSIYFRQILGKLHFALEHNPIPNYENRISFETTHLQRNVLKTYSQHKGQYTYFVEFKDNLPKSQQRWFLEVQKKRNNQTLHQIKLHDWSLNNLNNDPDFINLPNDEMRGQLIETFQHINPKKPIIIIVPPKRTSNGNFKQPANSISIDEIQNLYFIDNYETVSKVIVQLLYDLRCKLFHGELDPIESNIDVYKYAYEIQNILIKELR